jgi:hypothetical protein
MRKTVIVLLGVLVGCSSSSNDTVPGGPTPDEACSQLSALYCQRISDCSPLLTKITYPDVASCKASFRDQCIKGLAAPNTGANPQKQVDCTAAAAGISCTDLFADQAPDVCRPVAGSLADGSACGDDSQCASKYCSTGDEAACGKCGAAPAAGASCATQKCGPGLKCAEDKTAGTKTCVVPGNVGDACSTKQPCRIELSCTDGKCGVAAAKEGDTCNFNGTGNPQCNLVAGLICNPGTNKCVQAQVAAAGAACGYDAAANTLTACANQGVCKKAKSTDPTGTCIAGANPGDACNDDDTIGPKCLTPGKCVSGKCVTPDPTACK